MYIYIYIHYINFYLYISIIHNFLHIHYIYTYKNKMQKRKTYIQHYIQQQQQKKKTCTRHVQERKKMTHISNKCNIKHKESIPVGC